MYASNDDDHRNCDPPFSSFGAVWFAAIRTFSAKIIQPDAAVFAQSQSRFQNSEPDASFCVVLFSDRSEESLIGQNIYGEVLLLTHP